MVAVEFGPGIEQAWSDVAEFVPKAFAAVIIVVVGWLVARALREIVSRLLFRAGVDVRAENARLGSYINALGSDSLAGLLATVVYWAVLLLTFQFAIGVFGDSPVQDALDAMVAFLPRLFAALLIVLVAGIVASKVHSLVSVPLGGTSYARTVAGAASAAVWVVGLFAALDQLDVAPDIVDTLFQALVYTIALIAVIKFGVGGISAARERFWPRVYDRIETESQELAARRHRSSYPPPPMGGYSGGSGQPDPTTPPPQGSPPPPSADNGGPQGRPGASSESNPGQASEPRPPTPPA
ncbi:MAG: hypothetical protein S0880_32635 [Actinomycetota bacterium]|nr:hypothetical protein [Actinomycetota bacterium]